MLSAVIVALLIAGLAGLCAFTFAHAAESVVAFLKNRDFRDAR